jgi:hypothetical protein
MVTSSSDARRLMAGKYRPYALCLFIMPNGSAWYTTSQVARRPG